MESKEFGKALHFMQRNTEMEIYIFLNQVNMYSKEAEINA